MARLQREQQARSRAGRQPGPGLSRRPFAPPKITLRPHRGAAERTSLVETYLRRRAQRRCAECEQEEERGTLQRRVDCDAKKEKKGSEGQARGAETAPRGSGCTETQPPIEKPPQGTAKPTREERPAQVEASPGAPVAERQSHAPAAGENAPAREQDIAGAESQEVPQHPCALRDAIELSPAPAFADPAKAEAESTAAGDLAAPVEARGRARSLGEAASPKVAAQRDALTASSEEAREGLRQVSVEAAAVTTGGLRFATSTDPAADLAAGSLADGYLGRAGARLDGFVAGGLSAADTLRSDAAASRTAVRAAVRQRQAATEAAGQQLLGAARDKATAAHQEIAGRHQATLADIDAQASTARTQIAATYAAQVRALEQAHADQDQSLSKVYRDAAARLVGIGAGKGRQAASRARQHEKAYRNADNAPSKAIQDRVRNQEKDGFWDGYLTYNRYMARADAAREVGKQYQEGFAAEGKAQAENMLCGRTRDAELTRVIGQQGRETLACARDNAFDAVERQRRSAVALAERARAAASVQVERSLGATLARLDERRAAQLALLEDYGTRQAMAIERDGEAAADALLRGVQDAALRVVAALAALRAELEGAEAPPAEVLAEQLAQQEAQLTASFAGARALLERSLGGARTSLGAGRQQAEKALGELEARGTADAQHLAGTFERALGDLLAGTHAGYDRVAAAVREGMSAEVESATRTLSGVVQGAIGVFERIESGVEKGFQESAKSLDQGMQKSLDDDLDSKVCAEAEKAAAEVHPWWKKVLYVLLIIVVIAVVALVIGPAIIGAVGAAATALAGSLGAGAALAGSIGAWVGPIVGGAIVGAIAGAGIQIGSNLIYEKTWHEGLQAAIITGAIGGALGGLGGQLAQVLAGRVAATGFSQLALKLGTEATFDIIGGVLGDLAAGHPLTWESIAMGLAIGGAVQVSMGGLGGLAKARTRVANAADGGLTSRLAKGRLGRFAQWATDVQTGSMRAGEKLGVKLGGRGGSAPTLDATRSALDAARQRMDQGELLPTRGGTEPEGWRGPQGRPTAGTVVGETPITLGGASHTLKMVETDAGPTYLVCSFCRPVLAVLDELIVVQADTPVGRRLLALREDVATLHRQLSAYPHPDTVVNHLQSMMRILSEIDLMVPGTVFDPEVPTAGRPSKAAAEVFKDVADPQIRARAEELYPHFLRQAKRLKTTAHAGSKEGLEGMFPKMHGSQHKGYRRTLPLELEAQAKTRALLQAQKEVLGAPPSLEPGAPARLEIDPQADFPFGFYKRPDFDAFSKKMKATLPDDLELILVGSSITGRRFRRFGVEGYTETPFSVGRLSDYDVGIVSRDLYQTAKRLGIKCAEGDANTFVLTPNQLADLGLPDLHTAAQKAIQEATGLPHDVNFKIYNEPPGWVPDKPHLVLP